VDKTDLRPIEHDLIQAVITGRELVCSNLDPASLAVSDDEQYLIRAEVIRDILLGNHLEDSEPRGLRLARARITGRLDLDRLTPIMGLALSFCALNHPLSMRGTHLPWLTLSGTQLPGVIANGSLVDGALELTGIRVEADSDSGAVQLVSAYVRGIFDCSGALLINKSGPALVADDLKVDGAVDISGSEMTADCESGTALLVGALVGGSLRGDHAVLVNRSGPALAADSLKVTGPIFLRNSKCLGNHPTRGAVRLTGADTGRDLEFNGATLSNEAGAALIATGLRVNGTASFRDNFHAAGCHQPTLDLAAAQVGGGLDLGNSRILGQDGMALNLASASVNWICLPGDAICRSGSRDDPGSWADDGQLQLDGFTYTVLDPRGADLSRWLLWLHSRTPAYADQPYRQLATIYRSMGDEVSARKVLIAQQDDLLARGRLGGHWARAWHRLKKVTVGYGYQSWRALVGLIVIVILAIALGLVAGHIPAGDERFEAAHTPATGRSGTSCSIVEQVGLGLDLGLPAINTGLGNNCSLNSTTHTGQVLTVIAWLLQGLAWALATLVVAGYTGLIRRV